MTMVSKPSPKASLFARFYRGNTRLLLALPTLFAVMAMIGRSVFHASFDDASSSSQIHIHRLAAEKNHKKTNGNSKTQLLRRNMATEDEVFKPTRRDLHVAISHAKHPHPFLKHHIELSEGLPHQRRKLALAADDCKMPSGFCDYVFAVDNGGNNLYKLNVLTGEETRVGNMGAKVDGIAFDATTDTLYGVSNSNGAGLLKIDPCTGAGTVIGPLGVETHSLAADSKGKLYSWSGDNKDNLVRINKGTGNASPIGRSGIQAAAENLAFDDCDVLHFISSDQIHYIVNTTTGHALLDGTFSGNPEIKDYQGDVLPGSKLLYAPSSAQKRLTVVDLDSNTPNATIPTQKYFTQTAFVCDKPNYPDYVFSVDASGNGPYPTNGTGPKMIKVVGPGGKVEKLPPPPGHVAKPPPGGENVASELEDMVNAVQPPIDTGGAQVRYETPINTDYSIPFCSFMHITLRLSGDGPEARVKLQVYSHNDGTTTRVLNSSPVLRSNGLVFFVPLQCGNHTIQLLDGSGIPLEDSVDCKHAHLDYKAYPYNATEAQANPTPAPITAAPITSAPITSAPNGAPTTAAPITSAPITSAPNTALPSASPAILPDDFELPQGCTPSPIDLCIAIDTSGSVCTPGSSPTLCAGCSCVPLGTNTSSGSKDTCCKNFVYERDYAGSLVNAIGEVTVDGNIVQGHEFGLVQFATDSNKAQPSQAGLVRADSFLDYLQNDFVYTGGYTNTGGAIKDCHENLQEAGGSKKVMVLVTDGTPTKPSGRSKTYATEQATAAKNNGITILPVLIKTVSTDSNFLKGLGSVDEMIHVDSFDELGATVTKLTSLMLCSGEEATTVTTTTTTTTTQGTTANPPSPTCPAETSAVQINYGKVNGGSATNFPEDIHKDDVDALMGKTTDVCGIDTNGDGTIDVGAGVKCKGFSSGPNTCSGGLSEDLFTPGTLVAGDNLYCRPKSDETQLVCLTVLDAVGKTDFKLKNGCSQADVTADGCPWDEIVDSGVTVVDMKAGNGGGMTYFQDTGMFTGEMWFYTKLNANGRGRHDLSHIDLCVEPGCP
eukprot:CAMPEP_0168844534 /NCGR_PEP_ID=MMETSP0727-20121128/8789_1 /TAXON_ID=265536 /ORGANISM="Amphiprora sp., Strain CCMP467" /LENGTH=1052 /DNA_ID=CAMNT_0008898185 /DNA_START=33 /DNA_END=3191 /DNA_ORIENTATION=+